MKRQVTVILSAVFSLTLLLPAQRSARAFDVVVSTQGEFADAYLVNGTAYPPKYVLDAPDPVNLACPGSPTIAGCKVPRGGRHLNGKLCFFPKGFGHNGQFIAADDTYREACLNVCSNDGGVCATD